MLFTSLEFLLLFSRSPLGYIFSALPGAQLLAAAGQFVLLCLGGSPDLCWS